MSRRSLALVVVLTLGDYLLWSWSLGGSHDVLSLVSGLTLPPLALVCVWMLAVSLARLIAVAASTRARRIAASRRGPPQGDASAPQSAPGALPGGASTASERASSRKLAA